MNDTVDSRTFWQRWVNSAGLGVMRFMARLPLPVVRALGWAFGRVLHLVAVRRRRIARINWALCFPEDSEARRNHAVREHFVRFAQAWLDRGWLWEGRPDVVRRRLHLVGGVDQLSDDSPRVIFAPHFVGMDAGWTALTAHLPRRFCGIYAEQLNPDIDRWMAQGRQRFGEPHILAKHQGVKPMVSALRAGEPLYLLPDMDHGIGDAVFVPFFGVQAATLTSLPRFARLGRATVVPVTSRMTRDGYEVRVWPAWKGYPSDALEDDVARMNCELERMIRAMPEQYYWVHKRFKTRPAGEPPFYV
ncbi:LpxL/LpxP family acyltransferase [Hydrogenophaga aquatica]